MIVSLALRLLPNMIANQVVDCKSFFLM